MSACLFRVCWGAQEGGTCEDPSRRVIDLDVSWLLQCNDQLTELEDMARTMTEDTIPATTLHSFRQEVRARLTGLLDTAFQLQQHQVRVVGIEDLTKACIPLDTVITNMRAYLTGGAVYRLLVVPIHPSMWKKPDITSLDKPQQPQQQYLRPQQQLQQQQQQQQQHSAPQKVVLTEQQRIERMVKYPVRDESEEEQEENEDQQDMLHFLQTQTAFASLPMPTILAVFRAAANRTGRITRPSFEQTFAKILPSNQPDHAALMRAVGDRLFDLFDRDGSGDVDVAEFVSGLSLLCRASSGDKHTAAFQLFDADGDGEISLEEMQRYMVSFFEVIFALDESMASSFDGASAREVGLATAAHCFDSADANHDGTVTFDEFKRWCASEDGSAYAGIMGVN